MRLEWLGAEEAPAEVYERYLKEGELGFQRCRDCEEVVFYPRLLCPNCRGSSLAWETSNGRGTVYATTAMHHRDGEPHNVVLVDLVEGFRMMSRVEGVPTEEVKVGQRVAFEVREEDDEPVAVFVPEQGCALGQGGYRRGGQVGPWGGRSGVYAARPHGPGDPAHARRRGPRKRGRV